jgi:hypothetical protein
VADIERSCERTERLGAVRHEQAILGQNRREMRLQRRFTAIEQHAGKRGPMPVTSEQDRCMLVGQPGGLAVPPRVLAGRPTSLREPLADTRK